MSTSVFVRNSQNGGTTLKEKFPELYEISSQKLQTVASMGSFCESGWEWKFSWRRNLFDNEMGRASAFIDQTAAISPNATLKDSWEAQMGANQNLDFVDIWKLKIPAKSLVFAWRLIRDRLPTRMNLRRRQVVINEVQCPFCGDVEEEVAHLFFNCKKILPIWWESLSWIGLATALPQNPRDHYLQHMAALQGESNSQDGDPGGLL
ncbi:hypothetical protein GmHk_10G028135 [Glycine max]|nr:hypothetical protein GmHk_10G028135 [Glycine max]